MCDFFQKKSNCELNLIKILINLFKIYLLDDNLAREDQLRQSVRIKIYNCLTFAEHWLAWHDMHNRVRNSFLIYPLTILDKRHRLIDYLNRQFEIESFQGVCVEMLKVTLKIIKIIFKRLIYVIYNYNFLTYVFDKCELFWRMIYF